MISPDEVLTVLRRVIDPELHQNIVELGMVRDLAVEGGRVAFTLALTIPGCPLRDQLVAQARQAIEALPGVESATVTPSVMNAAERQAAYGPIGPPPLAASHKPIGRVLAVMSGKGGVGKSLVTGLLAAALARAGRRVGVLDADVTGPSIPKLFGIRGPLLSGPEGIEPGQSRSGIRLMSVNFMLEDEGQAVIWRGPLISSTIQYFWNNVHWGTLDDLLVDLPPGTSDAALTVMQSLPVSGIVMITTPQALSAMIVRKAVKMAQIVKIPILGVIENMAGFTAPDSGTLYEIFGPSHAAEVAEMAGAPVLARLPIDPQLAARCDSGEIEQVVCPEADQLAAALIAAAPQVAAAIGAGIGGGLFRA